MSSGKVIVVGAGLMGTGIAHAFASSGFATILIDSGEGVAARSATSIGALFDEGVARGKMTAEDAEASRSRLTTAVSVGDECAYAVLFSENTHERLDIKHQIMRRASEVRPADAIIGTNTSALSITEIAAVVTRPERVIGMHFFNPVHKMKLVELICGLATDVATLEASRQWIDAIGKASITVNESPGFTTSRMSALMGNEAMYMLAEGVATAEDIDTSLRMAFNHPMGPLELGDLTGWDTRLSVLQYLHGVLGEKFRPCPLIHKMVKAGRHGRKTGAGVYLYDEEGKKIADSGLKVGL